MPSITFLKRYNLSTYLFEATNPINIYLVNLFLVRARTRVYVMINHYNLIFKKKKESWKQKAHKNQFLINISEGMYNKETK